MYFLKKNIPLLTIIILTVIVALTMAVLDIQLYVEYLDAKEKTDENVNRIQNCVKKKPGPHPENVKRIEADIQRMEQKKIELQRMFGKIHRDALRQFADTIGMSESELLLAFKTYYEALPAEKQGTVTGENDKAILDGFLKSLYVPTEEELEEEKRTDLTDEEKAAIKKKQEARTAMKVRIDKALKAFEEYAAARCLDYDNNGYKYLLDAMGLPHTELTSTFKRQMTVVNEKVLKLIPGLELKVSAGQSDSKGGADVSHYTFDSNNLPLQRDTYLACRLLQIKLDLYGRMKKSGIQQLVKMETVTPLGGKKDGDSFIIHTFRFELEGSMDSIRNFMNSLNEAYREFLVYNIRDVQLARPEPEDIEKLAVRTENVTARDRDGKISDEYGKTVIGRSSEVRCTLLVDNIIFVEDLLQRQVPQQN
ncbi:MAG: hypothetical protein IJW05_10380 [Lentisphaeria bacterium]|nr:hypothetical protein [Lentisphaeria bacterium]